MFKEKFTALWAKIKRHKKAALAVLIALLLLVTSCTAAIVALRGATEETKNEDVVTEETENKTAELTIIVTADENWEETSTPAIARVQGEDIDFYHAIAATEDNYGESAVTVAEGDYTVSFISPVNADGSVYAVSESIEVTVLAETEAEYEANAAYGELTKIDAEDVTDEMLTEIIEQIKEAITNGDETLKGSSGDEILEKLEENIAANDNASDEVKETASEAKNEVDTNTEAASTVAKSGNSSSASSGSANSSKTDSKDTGSGSSSSSSTSSSSSSSGSSSASGSSSSSDSSSSSSVASHTHTWTSKQGTKQVWVENWVEVPVYEEQTTTEYYIRFAYDGTEISVNDYEAYKAKSIELILAGLPNNYTSIAKTVTTTVQVGTTTEDQGYYTTQTYTYYVCTGCGATKE